MERLVDVNFRTILKELPGGDQYRLTGSRRVIRKTDYARQPRADTNSSQIHEIGGQGLAEEGKADTSNSDDASPSTQYY